MTLHAISAASAQQMPLARRGKPGLAPWQTHPRSRFGLASQTRLPPPRFVPL